MAKRKKVFPCGHRGYGQFCHRCEQEQKAIANKQKQRQEWAQTFEEDAIDLRHLPKNVVLKAREILQAIATQGDYRQFHGKRLRHDRQVISVPVTRHYRLICRDHEGKISPEAVISHEDYNVCKPGS